MFRRFPALLAIAVSCAGCSMVSGGATSPSPLGQDALGKQMFSLSGDRLGVLEATANSACPGTTRPYYKSVTGSGDKTSVIYTCE